MLVKQRWWFSGILGFLMVVRHGSGSTMVSLSPCRAKEFRREVYFCITQSSASYRVILHETEGVSVAVTFLAAAARRATWAMISHFCLCKVRDISLKPRMCKALVLPILEY